MKDDVPKFNNPDFILPSGIKCYYNRFIDDNKAFKIAGNFVFGYSAYFNVMWQISNSEEAIDWAMKIAKENLYSFVDNYNTTRS